MYIRISYIFALLQLAVCRCWANQCRCCCRCGKFRSGMSLPFEGTGRDSTRSFCQYIPILRSRRNMQSAGKMRGRRATATRRERCQRCGRQGEGRAEDRIKGEGRRGRRTTRTRSSMWSARSWMRCTVSREAFLDRKSVV